MTPADHPSSCQVCHGTGFMPAPSRPYRAVAPDGHHYDAEYDYVTPCTHHWTDDEPFTLWADERATDA